MKDKPPIPTIEMLHRLLVCDAVAGKLYWKRRDKSLFKVPGSCDAWNARFAGKETFRVGKNPYRTGIILGYRTSAHRVIWAMHYGKWPDDEIDHINHDGTDDRITNLREVNRLENSRNQKLHATNKSGVAGVCWRNRDHVWMAYIKSGGKILHLGHFKCKSAATIVRSMAENKYGYHKNNGRLICL